MKFTTPILALVAASTVYANHFTGLFNNLYKRTATDQCKSELKAALECYQSPTLNTLDYMCTIYNSEICQKFYTNSVSAIPSCKDEEVIVIAELFPVVVTNNLKQQHNLLCIKDEAGNLCPYAELLLKEFSGALNPLDDKQREEAKKSTCQSKICREATYKAFLDYEVAKAADTKARKKAGYDTKDDNSTFIYVGKQEAAKYMDTEECKAMSGAASSLKIGTGFFISIGLLLLSLYI